MNEYIYTNEYEYYVVVPVPERTPYDVRFTLHTTFNIAKKGEKVTL